MKGHILLINSNPDSPHPVVGLFDQDDSSFFYVNDNDTTFPTLDFQKFDLVLYSINPTSAMEMNVIGDLRSRLRKSCPVWVIGPDQVGIAVKAMHSGASYYWPESTPVEKIRQFLNDGPVTYGGLQFRREETLLQVIKEIALTMELDGLMNILMDSAMELSRADAGVFLLLDEKTSILSSRSVRGFSGLPAEMDYLGLPDLKCLDILHGRSPVLLHPT